MKMTESVSGFRKIIDVALMKVAGHNTFNRKICPVALKAIRNSQTATQPAVFRLNRTSVPDNQREEYSACPLRGINCHAGRTCKTLRLLRQAV
jgi:hypothetical protein